VTLTALEPWNLPVRDYEVLEVTFGERLELVAHVAGAMTIRLRLQGAFDLLGANGQTVHLNAAAQPWEELVPILTLRHNRMTAAIASTPGDDAHLTIEFDTGRVLSAHSRTRDESWQISGPGFHLIGLAAGTGIADFSTSG
jgi:hypothetical protein